MSAKDLLGKAQARSEARGKLVGGVLKQIGKLQRRKSLKFLRQKLEQKHLRQKDYVDTPDSGQSTGPDGDLTDATSYEDNEPAIPMLVSGNPERSLGSEDRSSGTPGSQPAFTMSYNDAAAAPQAGDHKVRGSTRDPPSGDGAIAGPSPHGNDSRAERPIFEVSNRDERFDDSITGGSMFNQDSVHSDDSFSDDEADSDVANGSTPGRKKPCFADRWKKIFVGAGLTALAAGVSAAAYKSQKHDAPHEKAKTETSYGPLAIGAGALAVQAGAAVIGGCYGCRDKAERESAEPVKSTPKAKPRKSKKSSVEGPIVSTREMMIILLIFLAVCCCCCCMKSRSRGLEIEYDLENPRIVRPAQVPAQRGGALAFARGFHRMKAEGRI